MFNKFQILTVAYHYIQDPRKIKFKGINILKLSKFIRQINYLKKNYNILDPYEFIEIIKNNKPVIKNSCILTFDDGYSEHFNEVFPILKKKKVKAIFFVPAKPIQKKIIADVNKIQLILGKNKKRVSQLIKEVFFYCKKHRIKINYKSLLNKFNKFNKRHDSKEIKYFKFLLQSGLSYSVRKKICNFLFNKYFKKLEKKISKKIYLNIKQLKTMDKEGMLIGGHGYEHLRLNTLNKLQIDQEIKKTRDFLRKFKNSSKQLVMCYPHGAYNKVAERVLKKYGFLTSFTSNKGFTNIRKKNLYCLSRFDTNDI